jgi:hypothetical protein
MQIAEPVNLKSRASSAGGLLKAEHVEVDSVRNWVVRYDVSMESCQTDTDRLHAHRWKLLYRRADKIHAARPSQSSSTHLSSPALPHTCELSIKRLRAASDTISHASALQAALRQDLAGSAAAWTSHEIGNSNDELLPARMASRNADDPKDGKAAKYGS